MSLRQRIKVANKKLKDNKPHRGSIIKLNF